MPPSIKPNSIWEKINPPAGGGVFIIAEAGKTFIDTEEEKTVVEYLARAKELVDVAAAAGADAVKFQTHTVEDEILHIQFDSPHFPNWKKGGRYGWVERNTHATPLNEFWKPLKAYCGQKGIIFFSTPMSRGAAQRLRETGMALWKIGSADILDFAMLDFIRQQPEPIIMSSGMSTLDEVEKGLRYLQAKNKRVALLHCLSKYPGLPEEAQIGIMLLYKEKFPGIPIGFSENSPNLEPSCIAVALGATIIERHITMAKESFGADHHISSTPREFKQFVAAIRKIEREPAERERWLKHSKFATIVGKKEKALQPGEEVFRPLFRKSLMAGCDIPADTALTSEMIFAMRPQALAHGLPSEKYGEVIGRKTKRALKKYDPITSETLS